MNMLSPSSKRDRQHFLENHLLNQSEIVTALRMLKKEDTISMWDESYEKQFRKVKDKVPSGLNHNGFQIDASLKGFGAASTQDDKPVAFASKTDRNSMPA